MSVVDWSAVARTAYEAYARSMGGKTYDGRDMPQWRELPQHIQVAWETAARHAVRAVVQTEHT